MSAAGRGDGLRRTTKKVGRLTHFPSRGYSCSDGPVWPSRSARASHHGARGMLSSPSRTVPAGLAPFLRRPPGGEAELGLRLNTGLDPGQAQNHVVYSRLKKSPPPLTCCRSRPGSILLPTAFANILCNIPAAHPMRTRYNTVHLPVGLYPRAAKFAAPATIAGHAG
jgi:hypothetical protein